jgi:hypothetical protein
MNINDLRAKYPGYADEEIIGALKATKYRDYSEQEIGDAIGYKPKPAGFWRGVGDLGVEAVSGVARGVKFTADAFGANNAVSRGAGAVDEFAREYLSASAKADDKRIAEIMAAAEDAGSRAPARSKVRSISGFETSRSKPAHRKQKPKPRQPRPKSTAERTRRTSSAALCWVARHLRRACSRLRRDCCNAANKRQRQGREACSTVP